MNQSCKTLTKATPLSRQRIVDAAFLSWGRVHFINTSLSRIAGELGVSKTAIYRHFRNKEEVIHAMEADYARHLDSLVLRPLDEITAQSRVTLEHGVTTYLSTVFRFFEEFPYHYLFLLRRLIGRRNNIAAELAAAIEEHDRLLARILTIRHGTGQDVHTRVRYLSVFAVFWMTYHHRKQLGLESGTEKEFQPALFPLTEREKKERITSGVAQLLRGFVPASVDAVDLEAVERVAGLEATELGSPDRICAAVEAVVREHGYASATVERIASRLGMTKSSLYHYFRNRDEMLTRTIVDEQRRFAAVAALRFRQLASDAQRLYGLFVLLGDYTVLRPDAAIVENWLRESNIEVQIPAAHVVEIRAIYTFITEMLIDGALAGSPEDAFGILQFIHYAVMQELTERRTDVPGPFRSRAIIRELYHLFVHGLGSVITQGETE